MIFYKTKLNDAYIIEIEKLEDERGFFGRTYCEKEFENLGIVSSIKQASISFNNKKGTLRGMHYQTIPNEEAKWVRCSKGAIYDVIIDLRPESPTYLKWLGVELNEDNNMMLYIPPNFAHGLLTLADNTEITYLISEFYSPKSARGIRWNDPAIGIEWPIEIRVISDRDRCWQDYNPKVSSLDNS